MSGIEQDQEKLMNASAHTAQNVVSTAANLSLLNKPKTKVVIKTARDEVTQTQKFLKDGTKLSTLKQSIANSKIGKRISSSGGNPERYADLIIKKAQIDNAIEQSQVQNESKKISRKL